MNKTIMIAIGTIAMGTLATKAQELPVPAVFPAQTAASGAVLSPEEFEVGALCKTYCNREEGRDAFWHAEKLQSFLESADEVDKGFDKSGQKFDAKSIAQKDHYYNVITWEGRFNSPVSEEFQFLITGWGRTAYIVTVNGKTVRGSGQTTLKVNLVKGIENKVYIASGSSNPITIQYTLTKYTKAPTYTLVPNALKHIVEDDCPVFELK